MDPFYAVAHLDGANQTPKPIDTNTTAGALSRLGDACAEPCAGGSAQQPLALGACMQQTAGSLVSLSFLAAGHACLCAVAQPSTHPPGPAPSDLCAVFQIVIGKTYASWVLGVEGIDEMTMAHIHYVSCLFFVAGGGKGGQLRARRRGTLPAARSVPTKLRLGPCTGQCHHQRPPDRAPHSLRPRERPGGHGSSHVHPSPQRPK